MTYVHSYPVHIEYGEILDNGLERSLEFSNLWELIFICSHKIRLPDNTPAMAYILSRSRSRGLDQDFQCGFLDTHPFDRLHSISLLGGFTGTEIMRFILLPAIQTVVAKIIASLRKPSLPSNFSLRTSSLTSLSLIGDGFWSIQPETLQAFCSACPFLQDLRCQIPVSAHPYAPFEVRSSYVTDAVSPAALNVTSCLFARAYTGSPYFNCVITYHMMVPTWTCPNSRISSTWRLRRAACYQSEHLVRNEISCRNCFRPVWND
jgi:hypothetical protein